MACAQGRSTSWVADGWVLPGGVDGRWFTTEAQVLLRVHALTLGVLWLACAAMIAAVKLSAVGAGVAGRGTVPGDESSLSHLSHPPNECAPV